MEQEVFVAREGGVAALNAVSNRGLRQRSETKDFRSFAETLREEGFGDITDNSYDADKLFYASKHYGDVLVEIRTSNDIIEVFAVSNDNGKDLVAPVRVKNIKEAVKKGEEFGKTVFAPNEPRIFEIKLSDGHTLRRKGVDIENIQENFAQGWRELFGTYDGMPDFKTVKQHKLK